MLLKDNLFWDYFRTYSQSTLFNTYVRNVTDIGTPTTWILLCLTAMLNTFSIKISWLYMLHVCFPIYSMWIRIVDVERIQNFIIKKSCAHIQNIIFKSVKTELTRETLLFPYKSHKTDRIVMIIIFFMY